jgi:tRNA U34 5-carboxymethylaminomethyl modifying GTPase MnmE/TrmE
MSSQKQSMGADMGAMKNLIIDIESTMLDSSLKLSNAIVDFAEYETYEEIAREVKDRMQTIIDIFEMTRS